MRVALFTPLPPAKTGTADYAAALIPHLASGGSLEVAEKPALRFNPHKFDLLVYEIANNIHHAGIFKLALKHPGIVVLHEVNLHHLIQQLTLAVGRHEEYIREVKYEIFGEEEIHHSLNVPVAVPQGSHFTLLRRLLERSLGCIVHSRYAAGEVMRRGFRGPVRVIPHGAAVRRAGIAASKSALGLHEGPVIGLFGYQRRNKRILECLEMFRRLVDTVPGAQLLIAGEPHPDVPLEENISALNLDDCVRVFGYLPNIRDFERCLESCDVILNLRWPTYGETSGILMRGLGLGKVVIVNDEGACAELPDDICVKIPQDNYQWEVVGECLKWICSEPGVRERIGDRALRWVGEECTWERAASLHWEFFREFGGTPGASSARLRTNALVEGTEPPAGSSLTPESVLAYLHRWIDPETEGGRYCLQHLTRFVRMLLLTPAGSRIDSVLEMGCYLQITPALCDLLGYGEVRGCYLGEGPSQRRRVTARDGRVFECLIDLFDAESDCFPYRDCSFKTVVCGELIEHLRRDPVHMMREIHRVLQPGGFVLLTTPNIVSLRSVAAVLRGFHPGYFSYYMNPMGEYASDARHEREYTPGEVHQLLAETGFSIERIETGPYLDCEGDAPYSWVKPILDANGFAATLRGECILAIGRKDGSPSDRLPAWLYA